MKEKKNPPSWNLPIIQVRLKEEDKYLKKAIKDFKDKNNFKTQRNAIIYLLEKGLKESSAINKICKRCKKLNHVDNLYCSHCGYLLDHWLDPELIDELSNLVKITNDT